MRLKLLLRNLIDNALRHSAGAAQPPPGAHCGARPTAASHWRCATSAPVSPRNSCRA